VGFKVVERTATAFTITGAFIVTSTDFKPVNYEQVVEQVVEQVTEQVVDCRFIGD